MNIRISSRLLIDLIVLISFLVMLHTSYYWWKTNQNVVIETKHFVNDGANNVATDINNQLTLLMKTTDNLADSLSNGTMPYANVKNKIKQIIEIHSGNFSETQKEATRFFSLTVAFEKGVYDKSQPNQLNNWMCFHDKNGQLKIVTKNDDYTLKNHKNKIIDWYSQSKEAKKSLWSEPYFDNMRGDFMVSYTSPFFTSIDKKKVAGVVSITLRIEELKKIMYAGNYRKIGFAILMSKTGKLIYHPNRNNLLLHNVQSKASFFKDKLNFVNQISQYSHKNFGEIIFPDKSKGLIISKKIPAAQWNLSVIFFKDALKTEQKLTPFYLRFIISSIFFIITLAIAIFITHSQQNNLILNQHDKNRSLWIVSIITTIILLIGTAFLWYLSTVPDAKLPSNSIKLQSALDVKNYKKELNEYYTLIHKPQIFYIRTGIFIKSTEFNSSNNVTISGYIWQKFRLSDNELVNATTEKFCDFTSSSIPKDKGVVLSESNENKIDLNCKEFSYFSLSDNWLTLGWYFKAEFREPFDYSNYPLDKNIIWMRLRSNSFSDKVILIPDLRAYSYTYEKSFLGIDIANLVLPSWHVIGSFFSASPIELENDMGVTGYADQINHELFFNVEIQRDFLDAFISTVIPIFLIYLILFVILFSSLDSILEVLAINAGLLFSVALWHSGLRTVLASSGITYFESFYFICYLVISLISINTVLLASDYSLSWLRYEKNVISKLVFFPLIIGVTFITSLVMLF